MLAVKTYVASAGAKGLGLFAAEPICAGESWWVYSQHFDRIISPSQVRRWAPLQREFLNTYATHENMMGVITSASTMPDLPIIPMIRTPRTFWTPLESLYAAWPRATSVLGKKSLSIIGKSVVTALEALILK